MLESSRQSSDEKRERQRHLDELIETPEFFAARAKKEGWRAELKKINLPVVVEMLWFENRDGDADHREHRASFRLLSFHPLPESKLACGGKGLEEGSKQCGQAM